MLQEQKRVADALLLAGIDDTLLDLETLRIRDPAEMEKVDQHGELYVDRHTLDT